MPYSDEDIMNAYRNVGVGPGMVVYVTSDMLHVSDYAVPGGAPLMAAHYRSLRTLLGDDGTLVVPTRSMQICNTDIPFDPISTKSVGVGAFSEYVRTQPDAVRSFHPFVSYAAVGGHARHIAENVSRHAYGPETPEARMIDMSALHVTVGVEPTVSCGTVHHCEQVMAVPYRYAKEFMHPVIRDGRVSVEPFYMYVWYRDIGVECDRNIRLFAKLAGKLEITETTLGRGFIKSYSKADFFKYTCRIMAHDDIYIWCKMPPEIRPYRQ